MMDHRRECLQSQGAHYDIRDIDEELYLAVLARRREQDAGDAGDLG